MGYAYCMVDFICIGIVDLRGSRNKEELQNEKILVNIGIRTHKRNSHQIGRKTSFRKTTGSDERQSLKIHIRAKSTVTE